MAEEVQTAVEGYVATHILPAKQHDIENHDVETTINYVNEPSDGTELTLEDLKGIALKWTNKTQVLVHDVRGHESDFTLDKHGFTYAKQDMPAVDFNDEEAIKKVYLPEMEAWAKKYLNASEVKFYDHIVRNTPSEFLMSWKGPARRPHIDTAGDFTYDLLANHYGKEEAKRMTSRRHALINMWRPLRTVRRDPLGVCDGLSVPESDQHRFYYRAFPNQTTAPPIALYTKCAKDSRHKWYYMHSQTPNDVLLFKIWEDVDEGKAKHVTHASFEVPGTEHIETRTSVEVRSVVCW